MSKIDYQALREAAVAIETVATPQKLLAFRMKVTPQVVLALLDELEAKDKAWSAQDNHINQQAYRIESLEKKNGELGRSLEAAEKRIAELEKSEEQLINERDHAESALADMYFAATGDRPEWSNWFGFSDAVDAVVDRIADLEAKQCIEEMSKQSCEARERDLFESWVMHSICISKSTLEGLRTET